MASSQVKVPENVPFKAYSYSLTLNNPQDHYEWAKGFNPDTASEGEFQALMQRALEPFTSSGKRKRLQEGNGAMVGCEKGETFHIHLYVFCKNRLKAEVLMSQYPGAHIEKTRGTAEECWDYLVKDPNGKHSDKSETKLAEPIRWGKCFKTGAEGLKNGNQNSQGSVWDDIDEFLEEGLTPKEISLKSSRYTARYDVVKLLYQQIKETETTPNTAREIVYHWGATGSGKTYAAYDARLATCQDILMLVASRNSFDDYMQQKHVVIEELRGKNHRIKKRLILGKDHDEYETVYGNPDIDYSLLLKLTDRNNIMLDTRYHNTYWCPETVHITSPYAPEDLYEQFANVDSAWELIRRFTKIVYHYVENGEYKEFALTPEEYAHEEEMLDTGHGEVGLRARERVLAKCRRASQGWRVPNP